MNKYFQAVKTYITKRSELFIGIAVVTALILIVVIVTVAVQNSTPKIVYQPSKACDLLTLTEAKELLGEKTLSTNIKAPVQTDHTTSSSCGYTDGSPDTTSMIVAAIIVRSGIDNEGVEQNKTEFNKGKPSEGVQTVNNLGDGAYFNEKNGQLNVLDGRNWIILSNGVGASPESNTLEKAVELAQKVVQKKS